MEFTVSLTPDAVAKAQAGLKPDTPPEVRKRIEAMVPVEMTFTKKEFDLPFAKFVKWLTGATVEVKDGNADYAVKLACDHAKFKLADRVRQLQASGQSQEEIQKFVDDYKPSEGRTSALEQKSPEELEAELAKAQKRLEAIKAARQRAAQA